MLPFSKIMIERYNAFLLYRRYRMLSFLNQYFFGPVLPVILIICGGYFIIRLGFFPILHFRTVLAALFRKQEDPNALPPWKSMLMALAGTLGVGNITGVAAAITAGGPGAVFWMWVSAVFAMFVKYAEILLAVKYQYKKDGAAYGGTPYYIRDGLKLPLLAAGFSFFLLAANFSVGNTVQTFAAAEALDTIFHTPRWITGLVMSVGVLYVTLGGGKRIVRLTSVLVPLLSGGYFIVSVWIILSRCSSLPGVFSKIMADAFRPEAGIGGILGYLTMRGLRFGTARGILSNEAGCGTAPFAYASAEAKSPVEQGFFGIVEVFVDTIVLCTMTAVVILLEPDLIGQADGTALALLAYEKGIGHGAGIFLSVSIVLFAFASVVAWAYYGTEALRFLNRQKPSARGVHIYLWLYGLSGFAGAVLAPQIIWDISDFSISVMTIVNVICILLMSNTVIAETRRYFMQAPGAKQVFRAFRLIRKQAPPVKQSQDTMHRVPTEAVRVDFRHEKQCQEYPKQPRLR